MNVHAIPINAIAASPPLASGHADDCCAPPIPHGAIVTDQQQEDAAMELEKRTTIRKNNPDAVTDAELAISERRKVAVENAAANQSHPQAHEDAVLQVIEGLGARMDAVVQAIQGLGARMDNLEAEFRTQSLNNLKVRSQNSLSLSLAVFNTS
jgi:hypothetical protein